MFATRPAAPPPAPDVASSSYWPPLVRVLHPGYADHSNQLLQMPAIEPSPTQPDSGPGVPYHIVHMACAIVTGNRFDGVLCASPTYNAADHQPPPEFLPAGRYYFHLPRPPSALDEQTPAPYPVVPNFREWAFPHDRAWGVWHQPPILPAPSTDHPRWRDRSCRVSNYRETLETAHLVPKSENDWFNRNGMSVYQSGISGTEVLDGPQNTIMLRQDIHTMWDKMEFSIVPKIASFLDAGPDGAQWAWFIHAHSVSSEIQTLYHNLQLQPLSGVRLPFLLARYAWDIFPMIRSFLQFPGPHRLLLRDQKEVWKNAKECQQYSENQGRDRSTGTSHTRNLTPHHSRTGREGREGLRDEHSDSQDSGFGARSCADAETESDADDSRADNRQRPVADQTRVPRATRREHHGACARERSRGRKRFRSPGNE